MKTTLILRQGSIPNDLRVAIKFLGFEIGKKRTWLTRIELERLFHHLPELIARAEGYLHPAEAFDWAIFKRGHFPNLPPHAQLAYLEELLSNSPPTEAISLALLCFENLVQTGAAPFLLAAEGAASALPEILVAAPIATAIVFTAGIIFLVLGIWCLHMGVSSSSSNGNSDIVPHLIYPQYSELSHNFFHERLQEFQNQTHLYSTESDKQQIFQTAWRIDCFAFDLVQCGKLRLWKDYGIRFTRYIVDKHVLRRTAIQSELLHPVYLFTHISEVAAYVSCVKAEIKLPIEFVTSTSWIGAFISGRWIEEALTMPAFDKWCYENAVQADSATAGCRDCFVGRVFATLTCDNAPIAIAARIRPVPNSDTPIRLFHCSASDYFNVDSSSCISSAILPAAEIRIWSEEERWYARWSKPVPDGFVTLMAVHTQPEHAIAAIRYLANKLDEPQCQMDIVASKELDHGAQDPPIPGAGVVEESGAVIAYGDCTTTVPPYQFPGLVDLWLPLPAITWTEADLSRTTYELLPDFYRAAYTTAAMVPFTTYLFSEPHFQIRWIVNSTAFHSGAIVACVQYSPHGAPFDIQLSRALQLPHVVLRAGEKVVVEQDIPFQFHRSFVRNMPGTSAPRRPLHYATIHLVLLSALRTGPNAVSRATISPYISVKPTKFYGRVPRGDIVTQMDAGLQFLQEVVPSSSLREIIRGVRIIKKGMGFDKPPNPTLNPVMPVGFGDLANGTGPTPVVSFQLNPTHLTTQIDVDTITDMADLARIPGVRTISAWTTAFSHATTVGIVHLDPSARNDQPANLGTTPVEFVTSMYQYWAGELDIEVEVLASAYHTGVLAVVVDLQSIEGSNQTGMMRTLLDLGVTNRVKLTIPYIHDNPWRTSSVAGYFDESASEVFNLGMNMARPEYMYITVETPLLCPETCSPSIDVVVRWSAGRKFKLQCPNFIHTAPATTWTTFPPPQLATQVITTPIERGLRGMLCEIHAQADSFLDFDCSNETNIKDLIRRPVYWKTIETTPGQTHFVTLKVPTLGSGNSGPFSTIMSLFRYWRGSLRIIAIDMNPESHPVYISLIPHCGRVFEGAKLLGIPPHKVGFSTQVWIPSVNPVLQLEIPFRSTNLWALTEQSESIALTPRDVLDAVLGMVAFTSQSRLNLQLWIAAGDDFQWASYVGVPFVRLRGFASRTNVNPPTIPQAEVQMDALTATAGYVKELCTTSGVVHGAAMMTPLGVPLMVARGINTVTNAETKLEDLSQRATQSLDRLDGATLSIAQLSELLSTKVQEVFSGFAEVAHLTTVVKDLFLDISVAIVDRSWYALSVGLFRLVSHALGMSLSSLSTWARQLTDWFTVRFSSIVTQGPDTVTRLVSILVGFLGTCFRIHVTSEDQASISEKCSSAVSSLATVSYFNQVIRLVQTIFEAMRDLVLAGLAYFNPETRALKALCDNSKAVNHFVTEAQVCMSELNANMRASPVYRTRFCLVACQAYQIQKLLLTAPPNLAKPGLLRLCADVIKFANEKAVDVTHCPERQEPFSIWISGKAGIGKSHLTTDLLSALINAVELNVPTAGLEYVIQPGSRHWNGYKGQMAVVFDDFANLDGTEDLARSISYFYQLKSTCQFIPEMASIEDKQIRGNPLILCVLSNHAFPESVKKLTTHPDAFFRRRDVVIDAQLVDASWTMERIRTMTAEQSAARAHLKFRMHNDPRRAESGWGTTWYTWAELVQLLRDQFSTFSLHAREQMMKRMKTYLAHMHRLPVEEINVADPYSTFYGVQQRAEAELGGTYLMPSERLEAEALTLLENLRSRPVPDLPVYVPGAPVVQSWCVTGTVMFIAGVLSSDFWRTGTKRLVKYANQISAITRPETFAPGAECQICHVFKPCHFTCANATPENMHPTCLECMQQWRAEGRLECPLCRSRVMLHTTPEGLDLIGMLHGLLHHTTNGIAGSLQLFYQYLDQDLIRTTFGFWRLFTAVNLLLIVPEMIVPYAGMCLVMDHPETFFDAPMDFVEDKVSSTVQTVASWWPTVSKYLPRLQAETYLNNEGVFVIRVRENAVADYVTPRHTGTCLHRLLQAQPNTCRFVDEGSNQFWIVTAADGGIIHVPDCACVDEQCPFRNPSTVENFYKRFLRDRGQELQSWFRGFHNQSNQRQFFRTRIPTLLRPTFMLEDVVVFEPKSWWTYLGEFYEQYKRVIWLTLGVATAMGAVYATYQLLSGTQTVAQMAIQGSGLANPKHVRRADRIVRDRRIRVQADGQDAIIQEKVYSNYVTIKLWQDGKVTGKLTAVGVFGHTAIIPKHYVSTIDRAAQQGLRITLEPSINDVCEQSHLIRDYTWDEADFSECPTTDFAIFKLPKTYPLMKDIRKYFWTRADMSSVTPAEGVLVLAPTRYRRNVTLKDVDIEDIIPKISLSSPGGDQLVARDVFQYNHSEDGACGSMLMRENHTRPILAMHIAGNHFGVGYAVIVTQELIKEVMAAEPVTQMEECGLDRVEDRDDAFLIDETTAIDYLGVLPNDKRPHIPTKSKIVPSAIHKMGIEPRTEPAILHKNDPRYKHDKTPLWYGVRKHGQLTLDFPTSQLVETAGAMWDMYFTRLKPCVSKPRRLTREQAVTGFPGIPFYDPMKLSTSAGYPWSLTPGKSEKRHWVSITRNEAGEILDVRIDQSIHDELDRKEQLRRQAIQPLTYFIDTLKDERKTPEKVRKEGGTRVFCAAPVDYTIACRQNLLHWCAAVMKARLNYSSGVGINPHGEEWTELFNRLVRHGVQNIVTLDYSNFGPGFNGGVAYMVGQLVRKWNALHVGDIHESELESIWLESINSVHIAANTVYQQHSGSASGSPITSIINTDVNKFYICLAWLALAGERASTFGMIWKEFLQHVCLVCYGDDLIMSVSDRYIDCFNGQTICDYFAKYRIVATDAQKLGSVPRSVSIWEATFLKRGFAPHPRSTERFLAPLAWASVSDATQWVWQSGNLREATVMNCESAILEAHGHGPKKFNEFKDTVNRALVKKKCSPVTLTWEEVDRKWQSGELSSSYIDYVIGLE